MLKYCHRETMIRLLAKRHSWNHLTCISCRGIHYHHLSLSLTLLLPLLIAERHLISIFKDKNRTSKQKFYSFNYISASLSNFRSFTLQYRTVHEAYKKCRGQQMRRKTLSCRLHRLHVFYCLKKQENDNNSYIKCKNYLRLTTKR